MSDLETPRLAFLAGPGSLDRNGEALVFLHGFGGVAAQWQSWLKAFAPDIATFAFDLPGHGGSKDFPGFGPPKVAARAVLAEMNKLAFDRLHLVGHSMGGAVASLMALMEPEKIASLTLLAPGGFGPEVNHPLLLKWAAASSRDEITQVLPHFFGPQFSVPTKLVDFVEGHRARPGAVERLQQIASGIAVDGAQGKLPLEGLFTRAFPVTVVWGTEDAVLPVHQAERLKPLADNGKLALRIIEGMGHSPAEEDRALITRIIRQHLADS